MSKGYYLGIALETVDPNKYGGWDGYLSGTVPDVHLFERELSKRGFEIDLLLTKDATINNVQRKFEEYAKKLTSSDLFVVHYSGHGGYYQDQNGDEDDGRDETWCLYDGEMLDDIIWEYLKLLPEGCRVLMFSDSCHSGTVYKEVGPPPSQRKIKFDGLKCTLKFFGGSRDNQTSADLGVNGLFTLTFWNRLRYLEEKYPKKSINPSYIYRELVKVMPRDQQPTYFNEGPLNMKFNKKHIFKI